MALIDASDSEEEADNKKRIKLPGTRHSDLAERSARPVMRVVDISFSPTGDSFFNYFRAQQSANIIQHFKQASV